MVRKKVRRFVRAAASKKKQAKPQPDEDEPQPTTELGTLMHDDSALEEPGDVSEPGEASSVDSWSPTQSVIGEDMMDVVHGAHDGEKHIRFDLTASEGVEVEDELDGDAETEIEPDKDESEVSKAVMGHVRVKYRLKSNLASEGDEEARTGSSKTDAGMGTLQTSATEINANPQPRDAVMTRSKTKAQLKTQDVKKAIIDALSMDDGDEELLEAAGKESEKVELVFEFLPDVPLPSIEGPDEEYVPVSDVSNTPIRRKPYWHDCEALPWGEHHDLNPGFSYNDDEDRETWVRVVANIESCRYLTNKGKFVILDSFYNSWSVCVDYWVRVVRGGTSKPPFSPDAYVRQWSWCYNFLFQWCARRHDAMADAFKGRIVIRRLHEMYIPKQKSKLTMYEDRLHWNRCEERIYYRIKRALHQQKKLRELTADEANWCEIVSRRLKETAQEIAHIDGLVQALDSAFTLEQRCIRRIESETCLTSDGCRAAIAAVHESCNFASGYLNPHGHGWPQRVEWLKGRLNDRELKEKVPLFRW